MFNLTYTLEDGQLNLTRNDNSKWQGYLADGPTGRRLDIEITDQELSSILAIAIDTDANPPGVDAHYDVIKDFLQRYEMGPGGVNVVLRPVP